jgi:predicted PurR-regulated permease PerM
MNVNRPRWSSQTKLIVSLLVLGLLLYLVFRFSAVIPPIILAIILAYVLSPLVNILQQRLRLPRTLATVLTYLLLIGLVIAVPAVVIPALAAEVTGLNLDFQRILNQIEDFFGHEYVIAGWTINGSALFEQAVGLIQEVLQPLFGQTLGVAVEVISSIVWLVFIVVVSFYLVKEGPHVVVWLDRIPPPDYRDDFIHMRREIGQIWEAFFRGQLVLALVVSLIFVVVGLVIGLPFTLAMAVLAGILEFLPSIGHGIWLTIASLLAFFVGSVWLRIPNLIFLLVVIGLHLVFQQFDLNYLIPRIIGRRVHLHPLVVILGIVAGAAMAGVLGIALAAPTIASARILGRYLYANFFDLPPFPEVTTEPLPPPDSRWWAIKRSVKTDGTEQEEENEHA